MLTEIKKPKINKETKAKITNTWKKQQLLCEELDLEGTSKKQLLNTIRFLEGILQGQQETIDHLRATVVDNKKGIATLIEKYEDQIEILQKENTQLTLSFEELKVRHFGKFEKRLKEFALRPDKKKDH